jgi:hypothetical protein
MYCFQLEPTIYESTKLADWPDTLVSNQQPCITVSIHVEQIGIDKTIPFKPYLQQILNQFYPNKTLVGDVTFTCWHKDRPKKVKDSHHLKVMQIDDTRQIMIIDTENANWTPKKLQHVKVTLM